MERYNKLFLIGFVIASILMIALAWIITTISSVNVGAGAAMGALVGAVSFVATKYGAEQGAMPTSSTTWKYASTWSMIATALAFGFGLLFLVGSNLSGAGLLPESPNYVAVFVTICIFFGVVFLVQLLLIRLLFPFLVKSHIGALSKKKKN